jgi:hypothetical protein
MVGISLSLAIVIAGLDPAIHQTKDLCEAMDCRVTALRAGPQ